MTAERVLALARGEIGVSESPAGSNRVKYNDAYGGGPKAWCCVFLWWLFDQAGAAGLFYGGQKTAYCPTLLTWYKKQGQMVTEPRPGDIVFFDFNGNGVADHVGLCERWDGDRITTIDGNTGREDEANGGMVMRRTRAMSTVCAVARPAYEARTTSCLNEEERARFDTLIADWLDRQAKAPGNSWSRMAEAKAAGITDGTRPQSFATREEVATMIVNSKT